MISIKGTLPAPLGGRDERTLKPHRYALRVGPAAYTTKGRETGRRSPGLAEACDSLRVRGSLITSHVSFASHRVGKRLRPYSRSTTADSPATVHNLTLRLACT